MEFFEIAKNAHVVVSAFRGDGDYKGASVNEARTLAFNRMVHSVGNMEEFRVYALASFMLHVGEYLRVAAAHAGLPRDAGTDVVMDELWPIPKFEGSFSGFVGAMGLSVDPFAFSTITGEELSRAKLKCRQFLAIAKRYGAWRI